MKKFLLSIAIVAFSASSVFAQENSAEKLRWKGIMNNSFWSNWELSIGGGVNATGWNDWMKDQGDFSDNVGWQIEGSLTKWFNPIVGARLQVAGGQISPATKTTTYESKWVMPHVDAVVNLSNWIGGYREDRLYYAIPYVGFGYTAMSWTKKSAGSYDGEFSATLGLLNKFRVCEKIDIELDLRTWMFAESDLPAEINGGGTYAFALSASVGVAYRFNNRGWNIAHPQSEVDGYLAEIERLNDELGKKQEEIKEANDTIAELKTDADKKAKLVSDIIEAMNTITVENIAFFEIGQSTLSEHAKASLEKTATNIINNEFRATVHGYADRETGSAKRNMELSVERAEAVKQFLIEKGVRADMISIETHGDTKIAFGAPHAAKINRCAIIEITKEIEGK